MILFTAEGPDPCPHPPGHAGYYVTPAAHERGDWRELVPEGCAVAFLPVLEPTPWELERMH